MDDLKIKDLECKLDENRAYINSRKIFKNKH